MIYLHHHYPIFLSTFPFLREINFRSQEEKLLLIKALNNKKSITFPSNQSCYCKSFDAESPVESIIPADKLVISLDSCHFLLCHVRTHHQDDAKKHDILAAQQQMKVYENLLITSVFMTKSIFRFHHLLGFCLSFENDTI